MKKILFYSTSLLLLLFVASCSSTRITSSWKDSDKHLHSGEWNKILVVALLDNETNRHKVEDELLHYMNGKGIVSYNYLDENINNISEDELRNKIKADGFDGAITMRLIDVDKEKIYIPEQHYLYPYYYQNFSRYYYRNWVFYSTPGYYVVSKSFIVETIVYSINDEKIIWSGITETFNPSGIKNMTNEIAKVIYKKMINEGFIQKK